MTNPLLRSAIASVIARPLLKALHSRGGQGEFSTASFIKLQAAGLIDGSFYWTEKGQALREALGIKD